MLLYLSPNLSNGSYQGSRIDCELFELEKGCFIFAKNGSMNICHDFFLNILFQLRNPHIALINLCKLIFEVKLISHKFFYLFANLIKIGRVFSSNFTEMIFEMP